MAETDDAKIIAQISAEIPGGPAFPFVTGNVVAYGMSLRDYFAGQAMQAQITARGGIEGEPIGHWASYAYDVADAIIAARDRR